MKVKGVRKYLYRAVDTASATVDFLLTAKRDHKAALRLLRKAFGQRGMPKKITIDKSGAALRQLGAVTRTITQASKSDRPNPQ